jgi:hypothetical protein
MATKHRVEGVIIDQNAPKGQRTLYTLTANCTGSERSQEKAIDRIHPSLCDKARRLASERPGRKVHICYFYKKSTYLKGVTP